MKSRARWQNSEPNNTSRRREARASRHRSEADTYVPQPAKTPHELSKELTRVPPNPPAGEIFWRTGDPRVALRGQHLTARDPADTTRKQKNCGDDQIKTCARMRRFEKAVLGWSARVLRARTRRAAGNPAGHACTEEARTAWFPGTCPAAAARLPLLELAEGRQCSIWKGGRIKNSNKSLV